MKKTILSPTLIAGLLLALAPLSLVCSDKGVKGITVEDAQKTIAQDTSVVLLDVRTPQEWNSETGHLAHATLIPLQELEQRVGELAPYKDRMIIAYCRTGNRSGKAAAILSKQGYNVVNMEGGITRWNALGLPVVKESAHR